MDMIEQLEKRIEQQGKRIEQLEKKLQSKEDKTPNWEKLAKAVLVHWDESYRIEFEKKYSFKEDSKYSRFDLKRAIKKVEGKKAPKKLKHWNSIYNELKELKEEHGGNYWDELIYLSKSAVEIYSEDVVKYILREGRYVDLGGRPNHYDEEKIIELWEKYAPQRGEIMETYKKIADDIGVPEYLSDRTKRIRQIIKND